jgi:hypothetical protein
LAKNGLGYILGDFVTSSSGHPARRATHLSCCKFVLQIPADDDRLIQIVFGGKNKNEKIHFCKIKKRKK